MLGIDGRVARACLGLVALGLLATGIVQAQTGPLEPRMVLVAMPTPLPISKTNGASIVLELSIGKDGKVTEANELTSSGDANFDQRVRKYYSKIRFMPALDDDGAPIESKYKFVFKTALDAQPNSGSGASVPPENAPGTSGTASGVTSAKVFDEVERINRMRCKDFAWEYDFLKDIAGAKPVHDERMLKTVRAMYLVKEKISAEQLSALNQQFPHAVRDSLDQCRKTPGEPFFQSVFVPMMKARLPH